jgi:DNA-binding transcriptional ArsR family regulator
MANASVLLATLADPTRRSLVENLRSGPKTVGQLAGLTPVSRSAVSQHLQVLKAAEIVEERRQGTSHFYSLRPAALGELRAYVDQLWTDALEAFGRNDDE